MYKENIDIYNEFVKRLTGLPARINARTGKSMKEINAYLLTAVKENTEAKVVEAWELILNNYDLWNDFHKSQIELHQINANLINIINSIKNGRPVVKKANSHQSIESEKNKTIAKIKSKHNDTSRKNIGS